MKKFPFSYLRSIVVVGVILYLSFAPSSTFDGIPTFENEDKLIHFLMYAGLCSVLIFDFRLAKKGNKTKSLTGYALCLAFPFSMGGTIEILQPIYFGRGGSWFDMLANVSGIIIAWVFMHIFENIINKIFVRRKSVK